MELINQEAKVLMEGCKIKARSSGLKFDNETLEYIVTNQNILRLSPKIMIPTMYDYWVHGIRVNQEQEMYKHYPSNPYETVIITRPAVSFYNDNNPDWLNVMIFYHVLGHIDFFQNNVFYKNTWDIDLTGQALSDKRMIAKLRSEKGRWVDYAIEFARGIDNLVGYHRELNLNILNESKQPLNRTDFYFDIFLQKIKNVSHNEYLKEITRYNEGLHNNGDFFNLVVNKYPEFEELYRKELLIKRKTELDIM